MHIQEFIEHADKFQASSTIAASLMLHAVCHPLPHIAGCRVTACGLLTFLLCAIE